MNRAILITLFFISTSCSSFKVTTVLTHTKDKSISDYFLELPSEYFDGLSLSNRKEILTKEKYYPPDNDELETIVYSLADINYKNESLRVEYTYESGQAGFIIYELRKFKSNKGINIITYSNISGAHNMFSGEIITFIDYGNEIKISKKEFLPKELNIRDFVKKNTPNSIIKKYSEYSSSSYELVYVENDIEYRLYDSDILSNSEIDNSYLIGNTIKFVWTGKKFDQQKVNRKE